MNKKEKNNAINNFIIEFQGQTFSSPKSVEFYLQKSIPALVEKIYKEELKIADDRWKRAEEIINNTNYADKRR